MKLIVGLGNPGKQYERTRHNLGFMTVEHFLKDFEPVKKTTWNNEPKFKSDMVELEWQSQAGTGLQKVILVKPKTHMNNSGMAVGLLTQYYKISSSDVWILHDDIDLPLGYMRIRFGGGSAGHHGIDSVMENLGTEKFWRFRMGTGVRPASSRKSRSTDGENHAIAHQRVANAEDYVLSNFTGHERGKVKDLLKHTTKALQMALEEGLEPAMNRFNTK